MSGRIRMILAVSLGASMLLTACGGDSGSEDDTTQEDSAEDTTGDAGDGATVNVEAFDFGFKPATLTVAAGDATVVFENTGSAPHTFTAEELEVDFQAGAGETAEQSFTAEAGDYDFMCTIHPQMTGTLTVE